MTEAIGVRPAIAELPELEANRAHAEWPFDVGLVPLRNLVVDDTYQRPPSHEFIARMASQFDPTLVGTIDVADRGKGIYAVLDGQQRFFAMTQVGKTACYCSIYSGMTLADEAGFFYRKNRDRKAMKPFYSFRARKIAGDEEAAQITDVVEAEGFILGPTTNDREVIGAIRAIEIAYGYQSEFREESLSPALRTVRESFFGRKGSLDATLLQGLGRFWQVVSDDEITDERLHEALGTVGPSGLLGMARDAAASTPRSSKGGVSMPWLVARKTGEIYNRSANQVGAVKVNLKQFV